MKYQVQINHEQLPVTIVQRRGQKNLRIRLKPHAVVVSGPANLPKKELFSFVEAQMDWIKKRRGRQLERLKEMDRKKRENQGKILIRGTYVRIIPDTSVWIRKPSLSFSENKVWYTYNPDREDHQKETPEPSLLSSFYQTLATKELTEHVRKWSEITGLIPGRVSIRNQKTKWGSCSSKGTISLNWRLILCPVEISDYIIVHELCHLKHFNHSPDFWKMVAEWYPELQHAKKWLRLHSEEIFSL
ncbi:SprT family zinc-dependent metalloprotease [Balneolaceae bacterium ANBcel3]|nr:SprT family zinc-dependent metalloprotease [Balneolaceae bacterium ANBcel3]